MNRVLLGAGLLAGLLALAHGIGGEFTSLRAVAKDRPTDGDKLEIRATWHLYTWQLVLSAAVLVALCCRAVSEGVLLRWFLVASFVGSGVVILSFAARRGPRGPFRHAQWLPVVAVGALAYWATMAAP